MNTSDDGRKQNVVTSYIQQYNKKFFIPHGCLLIDPVETDYAVVNFSNLYFLIFLLFDEERGKKVGREKQEEDGVRKKIWEVFDVSAISIKRAFEFDSF